MWDYLPRCCQLTSPEQAESGALWRHCTICYIIATCVPQTVHNAQCVQPLSLEYVTATLVAAFAVIAVQHVSCSVASVNLQWAHNMHILFDVRHKEEQIHRAFEEGLVPIAKHCVWSV